jgi:hypothetical protein
VEGNICKHEGDKSKMKFYFIEVLSMDLMVVIV